MDEDDQQNAEMPTKVTSRAPSGLARGLVSSSSLAAIPTAPTPVPEAGPSTSLSRAPETASISTSTARSDARASETLTGTGATTSMNNVSSVSRMRGTESVQNAFDAQIRGAVDSLRLLSGSMLVWCCVGLPLILLVPGATIDKIISGIGLTSVAAGYGYIYRRSRQEEVDPKLDNLLPLTTCTAVAGNLIALGVGICSPYSGLIALGLTFYCINATPKRALLNYAVLALSYLIMGILALTGVVSSTGLLDPSPRPWHSIALAIGWVELVYLSAYGIGQSAHRENAALMSSLEAAVREAAQRDALWREVRAELDRAAKLGGPGQFTGQSLGSYRLAEVIGRGGMGEVYAANRLDDGSEAAVKLLRRDALSDPDVVARFERESKIVEHLRSPHVVAVHEIGGRDALIPYIAMERLRGTDLATDLRNLGTLSIRETIVLLREVAAGLEIAHAAGIVHRDLKPHNLFRVENERGKKSWKILDFGVSKLLASDDATLTVNQLVGTPQYMAPEQASGAKNVDRRVDVHALAAIAYRALSGRMAFNKGEIAQVLLAVATEIPEDPRKHRDLPDDVAYVLRIGLAKKPADRFASAQELSAAFADAAEGKLAPELRAAALKLVEAEPWGSKLERS